MEKEFIPYEQALELKELGFKEECIGYYRHGHPEGYYLDYFETFLGNEHWFFDKDVKSCTAPLYQQAFRWLKWKTGTYGYHFIYQTSGGLLGVQNIEEYYKGNKQTHGYFGPYEDAELDCIKQLIEIAKKDNR